MHQVMLKWCAIGLLDTLFKYLSDEPNCIMLTFTETVVALARCYESTNLNGSGVDIKRVNTKNYESCALGDRPMLIYRNYAF